MMFVFVVIAGGGLFMNVGLLREAVGITYGFENYMFFG
jgi:hypothetical protein